jgi:hypothetical protein
MLSLLKLLAVLLICLVGIGFYLGWFSLSNPSPDTEGNKVNINVSVDKGKIKSDVKKAEQKVEEKVEKFEGRAAAKEEVK